MAMVHGSAILHDLLSIFERILHFWPFSRQLLAWPPVCGYYISRRMWDDATDLFAADSVYELGGVGVFDGPRGVRKALERQGPAGLTDGVLNDRLQFDTIANIAPNGVEAKVRGIELGLVGDAANKQAHWEVSIYDNRFVKERGVWKVREMRVFPMFRSEYGQGWGKSRVEQPHGDAPDRPVPAGDAGEQDRLLPAFVSVNPGTGKPVDAAGYKLVATTPLTARIAEPPSAKVGDIGTRSNEVERRLAIAVGSSRVDLQACKLEYSIVSPK